MPEYAIELKGLQKTYGVTGHKTAKTAVTALDLQIPKGKIFGLLGPNGAGKSTTINILAGLVRKTAGTVTIWGIDQDDDPRESRAHIGVMPQELNLDPYFTPRASLETQAGLYGIRKSDRRTDELLDMVGLGDKGDAYARSLSGGMRRRLLLAKAMVHSPPILVLDEPTAGVDIELRQMLWGNIRKLNDQGTTVILTTHYLEEAQEMCDDIAIISHGDLIAQDSTKNLLARLDGKTMIVHSDAPRMIDLPDGVTQTLHDGGVMKFTYARNTTPADVILDALRTANISINDIKTEEADLEDVFLALTRSAG